MSEPFDPYTDSFEFATFVSYWGNNPNFVKMTWNGLQSYFRNPKHTDIDAFDKTIEQIYARKKEISRKYKRYISGASYYTLTDRKLLDNLGGNKTFRCNPNVARMNMLILDYDRESNPEKFFKKFRDLKIKCIIYPSVGNGYTTFTEKHADAWNKDFNAGKISTKFDRQLLNRTIYKYRVVIPFAESIGVDEWNQKKDHAKIIFGDIDTSCLTDSQSHGLPLTCDYDPYPYKKHLRIMDAKDASFLDIKSWPVVTELRTNQKGKNYTSSGKGFHNTRTFYPDTTLEDENENPFSVDSIANGVDMQIKIMCPAKIHLEDGNPNKRRQTAFLHIDSYDHTSNAYDAANYNCLVNTCEAHTSVRMTMPALYEERLYDIDFNKCKKSALKDTDGYDTDDIYFGLTFPDGTLLSVLTVEEMSERFKKMKFFDKNYYYIKQCVEKALHKQKLIDAKEDAIFDVEYDSEFVRKPPIVHSVNRLDIKQNPMIRKLKNAVFKNMINAKQFVHTDRVLLTDEEGTGKSSFALYVAGRMKVNSVFACASWVQAHEQFKSFKKTAKECDVDVDIVMHISEDQMIRDRCPKYNPKYSKAKPFESGEIDRGRKLEAIKKHLSHDEANELLRECEDAYKKQSDDFKELKANSDSIIVITTHAMIAGINAQIRSLDPQSPTELTKNKQKVKITFKDKTNPFIDFLIWIDDAKRDMFENYMPVSVAKEKRIKDSSPQYDTYNGMLYYEDPETDLEENDIVFERFNNKHYFERRQSQVYGEFLKANMLIFTTTEFMCSELIKRTYPTIKAPKLIDDVRLSAGRSHLMGTDMVSADNDGIIPIIVDRLNASIPDVKDQYTLIGNGFGSTDNLSNSKGQNSYMGKNLIIEVSQPHPSVVARYRSLEFNGVMSTTMVKLVLLLDDMHQAIGRNGGHRYRGNTHQIVLVPNGKMLGDIVDYSRYYFNSVDNMDADSIPSFDTDRQEDMGLFNDVVAQVKNDIYNKSFLDDIKSHIEKSADHYKKDQFLYRLEKFFNARIDELMTDLDRVEVNYKIKKERTRAEKRIKKRIKNCHDITHSIRKMVT